MAITKTSVHEPDGPSIASELWHRVVRVHTTVQGSSKDRRWYSWSHVSGFDLRFGVPKVQGWDVDLSILFRLSFFPLLVTTQSSQGHLGAVGTNGMIS